AALLHDVGKMRVPRELITKPSGLTPEERRVIETHTVEGERMLARVGGLLGDVGVIVRSCHERWDGLGYPDGLAAGEIPLVARIRTYPELGVRDLAAREGVSPPAMTRYLDRMEKADLIVRMRSVEDARRIKLALTPKGVRALRSVRRRRTAWLAERLEGLSP